MITPESLWDRFCVADADAIASLPMPTLVQQIHELRQEAGTEADDLAALSDMEIAILIHEKAVRDSARPATPTVFVPSKLIEVDGHTLLMPLVEGYDPSLTICLGDAALANYSALLDRYAGTLLPSEVIDMVLHEAFLRHCTQFTAEAGA